VAAVAGLLPVRVHCGNNTCSVF